MPRLVFTFLFLISTQTALAQSAAEPDNSSLTLALAEQRALAHNPRLKAVTAARDAAAGQRRQASLLPNPEIGYTRENMGNDTLAGLDGPTSTWQVSQRIEWAGQRGARAETAEGESEAAAALLALEKRLLLAELRTIWTEVLAAQERVAFAEELDRVSRDMRDAVAAQVRAGKVSPVELTRTQVAVAGLQRRVQQAQLTLAAARSRLAGLMGQARADFGSLPGPLPERSALPPLADLEAGLAAHPALQNARARKKAREGERRQARAASYPDVTLTLGQRQFEEAGESAWLVGASLPLPLFDRQQGARAASEARMAEANAELQATEQALRAELELLHASVQTLAAQWQDFDDSTVPASIDAYSAVSKGYRYGKFGLLDVLDAQRTLIDVRFERLDTLIEYQRQRQRLDALTVLSPLALPQENSL